MGHKEFEGRIVGVRELVDLLVKSDVAESIVLGPCEMRECVSERPWLIAKGWPYELHP